MGWLLSLEHLQLCCRGVVVGVIPCLSSKLLILNLMPLHTQLHIHVHARMSMCYTASHVRCRAGIAVPMRGVLARRS